MVDLHYSFGGQPRAFLEVDYYGNCCCLVLVYWARTDCLIRHRLGSFIIMHNRLNRPVLDLSSGTLQNESQRLMADQMMVKESPTERRKLRILALHGMLLHDMKETIC